MIVICVEGVAERLPLPDAAVWMLHQQIWFPASKLGEACSHGEAAIPLVLANLLNLYAGIGAILSLELTIKEVFILAIMMSFSHHRPKRQISRGT
jgi:hypothetical protein